MTARTVSRIQPIADAGPELAARAEILETRLDDGYRRIEEAIVSGDDVATWETYWFELLDEYESLFDQQREAA